MTMTWWSDLDILNRMAFWLTVLAVASPFVFGLATLAVRSRAKVLEDRRVDALRKANEQLQQDLGHSQRVQDNLRAQVGELEREQRGRVLSPEQIRTLAAAFRNKSFTNRSVYLEAAQGDREALQLATTVKESLELAGCQVDGIHQELRFGGVPPGIQVRHKPNERSAGGAIKAALLTVGLEATTVEITNPDEKPVGILVGHRP